MREAAGMRQERGKHLEREIDRLISWLDEQGIHGHKNHVKRTEGGVYLEGEPFDYEVFCNGKFAAFDAKECHERRWNLANAKLSQIRHLLNLRKHGADAFFLVYFAQSKRLVKFDVELVRKAIASGAKSLTADEGSDWRWDSLTTGSVA